MNVLFFKSCETELGVSKQKAWKLIEPANPIVARYYSLLGVEHLTGET